MNSSVRQAQVLSDLYLEDIDWHFHVYLYRADDNEIVDQRTLSAILESQVRIVADKYLASEFVYLRSGYILAHYGRRGITHAIWHWGDWAGTWECFSQTFYGYGRSGSNMSILDRSEPLFCWHEIAVIAEEMRAFSRLARLNVSRSELVRRLRMSRTLDEASP